MSEEIEAKRLDLLQGVLSLISPRASPAITAASVSTDQVLQTAVSVDDNVADLAATIMRTPAPTTVVDAAVAASAGSAAAIPVLSDAVTNKMRNMAGRKFGFGKLIFDCRTGTFQGSADPFPSTIVAEEHAGFHFMTRKTLDSKAKVRLICMFGIIWSTTRKNMEEFLDHHRDRINSGVATDESTDSLSASLDSYVDTEFAKNNWTGVCDDLRPLRWEDMMLAKGVDKKRPAQGIKKESKKKKSRHG